MNVEDKIHGLRALMSAEGVDALIVSNTDPHHNEYVADRWRCREWLTQMKGSTGTVILTDCWCGLWTDSRYYEIAEDALQGTEIELMRMSDLDTPTMPAWLKANFNEDATVAFYEMDTDQFQAKKWIDDLGAAGLKVRTDLDFVDLLWKDRPAPPTGELFLVEDEYAGKTIQQKITEVRDEMTTHKLDAYLLGRTDESCWLFNFRGTDIEGNPTPYCYTLVTMDDVLFFVDPVKLSKDAILRFEQAGVTIKDYHQIESTLKELDASTRLLLIPQYTNYRLARATDHCVSIDTRPIVTDLKAIKNETEMRHLRESMIDDGAAKVKFLAWIYQTLRSGGEVTELQASRKLESFRAEIDGYRHVSFESIMGYGPDGALNHYSVDEASDKPVMLESLFLIDSGGNFVNGTTDTTRTIPMGTPTDQQKTDYTLVLKAMLELLLAEFAEGATGAQLDGICRQALWKHGRNFKHGTGHGIGFGLEVHEGPQNFSGVCTETIKLGMVTTIEPGCYRPGEYGIRIENMVHTVLSQETEFGRFFKFENLTFCPINVDLIDPSLLSDRHIKWLNDYHREVIEKISPRLNDEERQWLTHECRIITKKQ